MVQLSKSFKLNEGYSVIHLSTGHDGGAGLAARRLNSSLVKAGVSSQFISIKNKTYTPDVHESHLGRNLLVKIFSAAISKAQSNLSSRFFFSVYSLNIISARKIKKIAHPENSILHIHNWFNLVNQKQITKFLKLGYLVVITLHDERFYTGGCHHAFECNGFERDCAACPQISSPLRFIPSMSLRYSIKNSNHASKHLAFIAPSIWIHNRAKKSTLMKYNEIYFIPNCLGDFGVTEAKFRNKKIDLKNPKVIGIASKDSNSYIKGSDVVQALADLIKAKKYSYKIIYLNELSSTQIPERDFWGRIDLLLVPSRAENSPNVIHEAKKLGIPVIASAVGGINEILDPDFDEFIPIDALSAESILQCLETRKNKKKEPSVEKMESKFQFYLNDSLMQHIELYNKLISKKNSI